MAIPDVQVHVLDLRRPPSQDEEALLSPEEEARRDGFYQARDRQAFTLCRAGLRRRLGAALGLAPAELRFREGPYGKPHLRDGGLGFNLSHSGDLALIAITELAAVGVDIERERPLSDLQQLAARYFSPAEQEALRQLPADLQTEAFFHGWSRKEAFIKAIGLGLSFPLERFDVSLDPRQPARLQAIRDPRYSQDPWTLHGLTIAPGYSAALVTPGAAQVRLVHPAAP